MTKKSCFYCCGLDSLGCYSFNLEVQHPCQDHYIKGKNLLSYYVKLLCLLHTVSIVITALFLAHPFGVRKKVSFITKKNCKVTKKMYLCMLE